MEKTLLSLIKFFTITLFCMQTSWQSSVPEKPALNFQGTIIRLNDEKVYKVENITISGLYQKIPVYKLPTKDIDPAQDVIFNIDLAEVQQIYPTHANPSDGIHTFKNRDYIEITIVFNGTKKTKEQCIIETSRKIFCDRINEAGPIAMELSFPTLKKLTITDYSSRDERKKNSTAEKKESEEKSAAQKALCDQTSTLINNLQSEAKKLEPKSTQEKITGMVGEIQKNTETLCS